MELYIRLVDNYPVEHPILGDNFRAAFPEIDTNNLPPEFARFKRIEAPLLGRYEKNQTRSYQFIDGVWTDCFVCEQMSDEEIKTVQIQEVKNNWARRPYASNWSAWTLDEATCTMVPPIPRPDIDQTKIDANIFTVWCGEDNNWKDTPIKPEGEYKFDFLAWAWVAL